MKKFGYRFFISLLIGGLLYSCSFRSTDYKDHLEFNNIDSLQTIIREMDTILHKLPLSPEFKLKHYHIRADGTFIINGITINTIRNLSLDDFYKKDIFYVLSDLERSKLLYNILYLYKNKITDALQGECFWQFIYFYKTNYMNDSPSHRMIIAFYNPTDTLNAFFNYSYQILDRKKYLVLYKSIVYTKINYNPPEYSNIKNPYDSINKK